MLRMFLNTSVIALFFGCTQINPFRPSPSHSAIDSQSFRLIVKFLTSSPMLVDPKKFCHQAETALGGPGYKSFQSLIKGAALNILIILNLK
jgi:hypothetical protein